MKLPRAVTLFRLSQTDAKDQWQAQMALQNGPHSLLHTFLVESCAPTDSDTPLVRWIPAFVPAPMVDQVRNLLEQELRARLIPTLSRQALEARAQLCGGLLVPPDGRGNGHWRVLNPKTEQIIYEAPSEASLHDLLLSRLTARRWSEHLGLRQKEAARLLGVGLSTWQQIELGLDFRNGKPVEVSMRTRLAMSAILQGNTPLG